MNDFDKRIEELSKEIAAARTKVDTALRYTVIFYLVVIVGITAYTLYLSTQIQKQATPQTVAALIGNAVRDKMPQIQQQLVQQAKTQAPIMATKTIDLGQRMLPQAEMLIKTKIDAGISSIVDHTINTSLPILTERIKANFDEISKNKKLITDKKTAEAIADLLSTQVALELDKVINMSFYNELDKLQKDLDSIAQKSATKLTQRELAEKRVIIYWLYLIEKAEPGQSPMAEILRLIPEYKFSK